MKNDDYETSDLGMYISHLLKFEIFNGLPRLDENEAKVRENVFKDPSIKMDKLKEFYDFIKKKYTNFPQLAYFDDEVLHEFYNYLFEYTQNKANYFVTIELHSFLYNYYARDNKDMYPGDFQRNLENRMKVLNRYECVKIEDMPLYNHLVFDEKMAKLSNGNSILIDLIRYNPDFTSSMMKLTFSVLYPSVAMDMYSILNHHSGINHMLIEFAGNKDYNDELEAKVDFENEEKLNERLNMLMNVIFSFLSKFPSIHTLCMYSDIFQIHLDESNSKLLLSLLKNNRIGLFLSDKVLVAPQCNEGLLEEIYQQNLKFVYLSGFDFSNVPEKCGEMAERFNEQSLVCMVRLAENLKFENFNEEYFPGGGGTAEPGDQTVAGDQDSDQESYMMEEIVSKKGGRGKKGRRRK